MKTNSLLVLSLIAAAGVMPAAPRQPAACPGLCVVPADDSAPPVLDEAARAALVFQIEEERMAHELYTVFGERWGLRPFANIAQAESRHESLLRSLAERAGLAMPTAAAGTFAVGEIQLRYDALLALGRESAEGALRAGAFVEEQDIADLRALAATTANPELRQAVAALERGSTHHLGAFVRNLSARGVTYAPQVLDAAEFAALTGAADGGAGRSRGARRGRSG